MSKLDQLRALRESGSALRKAQPQPDLDTMTAEEEATMQAGLAGNRFRVHRAGRPRIENKLLTIEAQKPWIPLKMSKRTWYRRQAEKRKSNDRS